MTIIERHNYLRTEQLSMIHIIRTAQFSSRRKNVNAAHISNAQNFFAPSEFKYPINIGRMASDSFLNGSCFRMSCSMRAVSEQFLCLHSSS